jgi:hypothetical protein
VADLRPQCAPHVRQAATAFFTDADGALSTICDLLDLDTDLVQQKIARLYPDLVL